MQDLSRNSTYSNIRTNLLAAVSEGLMDLDSDGSSFRFVHDKIREAAYDMISDSKDKFHLEIGMIILASHDNHRAEGDYSSLFTILDQISHGIALLQDEGQCLLVAQLYLQGGIESYRKSNYTSAYYYAKSAVSLLRDGSWANHYGLCFKLYILLSKASYSYRKIEEAKAATNIVIDHANSLQDKLDAYAIQQLIVAGDPDDTDPLRGTIIELLKSLGEQIPCDDEAKNNVSNEVCQELVEIFQVETDDNLLHLHQGSPENYIVIMQAYSILVGISYIRPRVNAYYITRWARYFLKHKAESKYVPREFLFSPSMVLTA